MTKNLDKQYHKLKISVIEEILNYDNSDLYELANSMQYDIGLSEKSEKILSKIEKSFEE